MGLANCDLSFEDLFSDHRHECCLSSVFQTDFNDGAVPSTSGTLLGINKVFQGFFNHQGTIWKR